MKAQIYKVYSIVLKNSPHHKSKNNCLSEIYMPEFQSHLNRTSPNLYIFCI